MSAGPTVPPVSVGIQVVLYDSDPGGIVRLAGAIAATVRHARSAHAVGTVAVRFGDSSRFPCLTSEAEAEIGAALDGVASATFTHFGANLGSGGGSNALAALGDDDAIWVLNPDTYPAPTALAELLDALARPGVGAAEGRQLPIEHQKAYDPETGETAWGSGFCLLLCREAFEAVSGFDAHYFPLYCDDVDLSWRLRLAGWGVVHVPRAAVFHDKRIDAGGAVRWSPTEARSSHLARLWLYRRYGRPDLERALLERAAAGGDPALADAAAEFERRVAAGDAPEPIADASRVAQFVDGQYAVKRFGYAG